MISLQKGVGRRQSLDRLAPLFSTVTGQNQRRTLQSFQDTVMLVERISHYVVIEVSHSSLLYDSNEKLKTYGEEGGLRNIG